MAVRENFLAFFGHIAIDVTMRVDFLPTHGTVGVNRMEENFGGTAGNFAMVAARLGAPFQLFSAVSSRTHNEYMSFLSSIGVDVSHIAIDNSEHGPIGYAVTTGKDQLYYFYQGPMNTPLTDRMENLKMDYDYVHFGTGLPLDFIRISQANKGLRYVFDPGQEITYRYNKENLQPLLDNSSLVMFNEAEEEMAAKILGISKSDLRARCGNLIVTRGSRGVTFYRENETLEFGTIHVENPYDTIGAGDAFRAGMYFAIHRGMDMADGIVTGSIVAAEAIKKPIKDYSMTVDRLMEIYEEQRERLILK